MRKRKQGHLGGNQIGGDPATYYPTLWDWLIAKFNLQSVLDIGCAEGHALEYFKLKGLSVFGIDGLERNIEEVQKRQIPSATIDLTKTHYQHPTKLDLGWCCEVVEHVEAQYVGNILQSFMNCKMIAMTHAVPRQRGYHHVNCQNDEYWIEQLKSVGFNYLETESMEGRAMTTTGYFRKSGLIFVRAV